MNRLVLIDGNAVMHRAYHALPPLTDPRGRTVNIVYGFISVIVKLTAALKPTHMAVAFDRPGKTFREHLLPTYQSQRPKMEDDFISQIPLVHEAVTAFGLPIFELDGFEADDMIGTIAATVMAAKGSEIDQVVIVTGDRDILQLVRDDKVLVYMPTKGLSEGMLYGEKEVYERMGVPPSLIVDLKALMGDASDNYPGVSGIGPKTAIKLLTTYGSFEAIYARINEISSKTLKAKLLAGKESGTLSKKLAAIRTDAPIVFEATYARAPTLKKEEVRDMLTAFRFPSLIRRIGFEERMKKPDVSTSADSQTNPTAVEQQELF